MSEIATTYRSKLSTTPIRKDSRDASEMVTELLFGEEYVILSEDGKWFKIRCAHDNYEGWMAKEQHLGESSVEHSALITHPAKLLAEKGTIWVSPGSRLDPGEMIIAEQIKDELQGDEVETALSFLGTSYLWGGRSMWGIDCSGLMQVSMAIHGIRLPRDASQQVEIGESIAFEEATRGDLAFFSNPKGRITHVGMLKDKENIIHASGFVRLDGFSAEGIHIAESGKLTHTLARIQRIRV